MKSRFRVRFRELDKGRDGGLGEVKSYKCFAKNGHEAARRLRKRGKVISVRKIPKSGS